MEKIGYATQYQLLNASDYGVPSNRYRVFIVCLRIDLKKNFTFPTPNIFEDKTTVGKVLSKPLPKDEKIEIWDLSEATINSIRFISEGGSWKEIPDEHLSKAHKKIRDNIKRYRSPNFYRRFSRNEVMGTITATSSPENSGIIHPLENRRYSVREIARFQSFEDDFKSIRYDFRPFCDDIESYETTNIEKNIESVILSDNILEHIDINEFEKKNIYWGETNKTFEEIEKFEKSLHKKYILCYYDCRHYVREFTTWALNKSTPIWYLDEIWNN